MTPPTRRLSQTEFIALMAMTAATTAFSIDAMLPSLPEMAAELSPDDPNRVQLIITSFVFGLGFGTFFAGPISDAIGRKPVIVAGATIYIIATLAAMVAQSLTVVLVARVVMGIGAAGPRVVAIAMIRDLYAGRDMARIISFVMMVFALVPAFAPTMGHYIAVGFGWRAIFVAFIVFALIMMVWMLLRQPETLHAANRRPVARKAMTEAVREMFAHHTARLSIFIQTLTFGMLFTVLSSTQMVFDQTFDQGQNFHLWFGGIAIISISASVINARFVGQLGMRKIIKTMYAAQIGFTSLMIVVWLLGASTQVAFVVYLMWVTSNFFQAGLTIGNLNALAMEEMGHIAGLAASVIAAFATVGAVILAAPVAYMFDGTPLPIALGTLVMAVLALWLTSKLTRPGDTEA